MDNLFTLFIRTSKVNVEIHRHSAFQIVRTVDHVFKSKIAGVDYENLTGFIIKPQVKHLCESTNSTMEILNIEASSEIGSYIASLFPTQTNTIIFSEHVAQVLTMDNVMAEIKCRQEKAKFSSKMDDRVIKIIQHINSAYFQNLSPKMLSELVFISPSRLSALFKEQTGSSISKFILWTRLRMAVSKALTNKKKTLTEIAHETGFYDLAQMNKYMYEMLGVSPRILKENSDLIQVL
jgi:AraC-like DNA-binding protein